MYPRLNRAAQTAAIIWVVLWGIIEPLAFFGVIPTPTLWLRLLFFAAVSGSFLVAFLRRPPAAVAPGKTPEDASVRVVVQPAIVQHPLIGLRDVIGVQIQNHSSAPVFIVSVQFGLPDHQVLQYAKDAITGEWLTRRELRPGDSFTIHAYPEHLLSEGRTADRFGPAIVKDAIGRVYSSDPNSVRQSLIAASQTRSA